MELQKIDIQGLRDIYAVSVVQKEFKKAVNEPWKDEEPWNRYQKRLMQDLAVLDDQKECAINLQYFERLSEAEGLYSIRHPETPKNVRIIYTITDNSEVILLTAFLEKNVSDYKRAIKVALMRLKWLESN